MTRLLFSFLVFVLAGFVFFQFTQPVLQEIERLRAEKTRLDEGLANAKELRQVLEDLVVTFRSFAPADLVRLNKLLPDNIDNIRLIIDVNAIAERSGIAIRNLRLRADESQPASVDAGALSLPVKSSTALGFSVSTPYTNFKAFLDDLARSLRLVDVTSLSFSPGDKNDFNLEITTYWLK